MSKFIFLILVIFSSMSYGGEVSDLFNSGIFDSKWGDRINSIKNTHPSGKIKKYGSVVQYHVKDGRTVLGVKRQKNDKIVFSFDSEGRLNAIGIYYSQSDFGDLLNKLNTLFGPHENKDNSIGAVITKWPKDAGLEISLMLVPSIFSTETVFSISYLGLNKPIRTKEQLGF